MVSLLGWTLYLLSVRGKGGGFFGGRGREYYVVLKGNGRDQSSPTKYKGGTVQK